MPVGLVVEEQKQWAPVVIERISVFFAFVALFGLAYTRNVNWDEFYFLSHVHAWLDGRLDRPMQTVFVHVFVWLNNVPGHEIEQIFVARTVMIVCLGVTVFSIYRIAKHLTSPGAATFAALAFLCSGFVLAHGGSFRADPIAAACLTSSLAVAMTGRLTWVQTVLAAALAACALLVTIKSALYFPAFVALFVWRWGDRSAMIRLCIAGVLALVIAGLLYAWHASGVVAAEGNDTKTNATDAARTALLNNGLFSRSNEIISWALFSTAQIMLAITGIFTAGRRQLCVIMLLFAMPTLATVFYRNAFVYFFPFATPLLMIAVAVGVQNLKSARIKNNALLVMLLSAAMQVVLILPENAKLQRATIAEVHRLFPEPVPYIDSSSMIASFPSAAFFMSSWGVSNYRETGRPIFHEILKTQRPPLLLVHKFALESAMLSDRPLAPARELLPKDREVLRQSYVHYAGSIWLAGAETTLTGMPTQLEVPFSGQYRVEATESIQIGQEKIADGAILTLDNTALIVNGSEGTQLRLIWDTGVDPIGRDEIERDIYAGFWRLMI